MDFWDYFIVAENTGNQMLANNILRAYPMDYDINDYDLGIYDKFVELHNYTKEDFKQFYFYFTYLPTVKPFNMFTEMSTDMVISLFQFYCNAYSDIGEVSRQMKLACGAQIFSVDIARMIESNFENSLTLYKDAIGADEDEYLDNIELQEKVVIVYHKKILVIYTVKGEKDD